ncbi:MAG: MFS transporter [Hyphomicrobiales bacterium]
MQLIHFLQQNARWLIGGFALCFCSSVGQTYFIALSGGEIRADYGLSHGEFGGLYMGATLLSAATLPFLGRIVDFRSVSSTVLLVFLGLAFCAALMWYAQTLVLLFIAIYGLRLFGQGMMTHIAMTAMGRWYASNRGRAVSIATSGLQLGEAVLPIAIVTLMVLFGWRQSWLFAAVALLLLLPLVYGLMKQERAPQGALNTEEDTNLPAHSWTRGEVMQDVYFWLVMIVVLAAPFIGTTIYFHQIHLLEVKGWSPNIFASSFFIMSISTVVCSLLFGVIIDRFSAVCILPVVLLPMAIASFLLASIDNQAIIFVFMAMFGISYGASSTMLGTLWPEIYGTKYLGSVRSIVVALGVFASALGPGATGILIDYGIHLEFQLKVMAIYCLVASLIMFFVAKALIRRGHLLNIAVTRQT